MELKDKIRSMLQKGMSGREIADILECNESYVSRIKNGGDGQKQKSEHILLSKKRDPLKRLDRLYDKAEERDDFNTQIKIEDLLQKRELVCRTCPHKKKTNPLTKEERALLSRGVQLAAQEEASRWTHNLTPEEIKKALEE